MATKKRRLTKRQREIGSLRRTGIALQEARTRETAKREAAHGQQRIETERALAAQRISNRRSQQPSRVRRVAGATGSTVASTGSSTTKTRPGQLVILVILVMGGLIVFYNLVSRPKPTSTKLGQLGGWLSFLSTDKPLFTKVAPTTKASGTLGSSGGNTA